MNQPSFTPFALEAWQSRYEQTVAFNLADSGVQPVTARMLLDETQIERLLDLPIHYPEVNGTLALRRSIAALYAGAEVDDVLTTVGAAEANAIVCQTLLRPGDEVVVMEPGYRQVWGLAHNIGCDVRAFPLLPERGWRPDLDALAASVSQRTRLIALVNPNNPTGVVLTDDERAAIVAIARGCGAWLLADEVYRGAERVGEAETPSFWGSYERAIVVNSFSKAYGLSGLRLGWLLAPRDLVEELWRRHEYATIAASAHAMLCGEAALVPETRVMLLGRQRALIRGGWKLVADWAARFPDLVMVTPPDATALAFVRYLPDVPSVELAERIRAEADVLVAPGACFGLEGYLRITHGLERGYVAEALSRVARVLGEVR